jgi:hypothetical protein
MEPDTLRLLSSPSLAAPDQLSDWDRLKHLMTVEVRCAYPNKPLSTNYMWGSRVLAIVGASISLGISQDSPVTGTVIGIVILIIAGWLWAKAREAGIRNAADVVLKEMKFPIVYLRPFKVDRESSFWYFPLRLSGLLGTLIAEKFLTTPEVRLIGPLWRELQCPVVAVANPDSLRAIHGALRVWISHEFWQQKVREFIRYAPVVLLAVGETKGSMWELEEVVRSVDPRRLVIPIPRRGRAKLMTVLNRALPKSIDELGRTTRFVCFDSDWLPRQVINADEILRRFDVVSCIDRAAH